MKNILLFIAFSTFFTGCNLFKKAVTPKPFYCKINGVDFIPEVDNSPIGGVGASPLKISFNSSNNSFTIFATNKPRFVGLSLIISNLNEIKVKEYILSDKLIESKGSFAYDINPSSGLTDFLYSTSGKLTITKKENTTIWGTFEFVTKSSINNTEYKITNGEFNALRY
jgi:hypothetical protein